MKNHFTFPDFAERLREFICRSSMGFPETLCAKETEPTFDQLAVELFRLQFQQNAAYSRFCRHRGVANVSTWKEIPAVPAAAFKELEMTSLVADERTTVFFSSGTTEQKPSRHFHNAESLALYEASLLPWFAKHLLAERTLAPAISKEKDDEIARPHPGPLPQERENRSARVRHSAPREPAAAPEKFPPLPRRGGEGRGEEEAGTEPGLWNATRAIFIILTPPPGLAPHSSLVHMFETVRRAFGSEESRFTGALDAHGAWMLDFKKLLLDLRHATDSAGPVMILGTAFNFAQLLDPLAEANLTFRFPAGSRVLETGGYKGRSRVVPRRELYSLITKHLGIPRSHIVSEYGMSELSSQAYDWTVRSSEFRVSSSHSAKPFAQETEIAHRPPSIAPARLWHFPPWARVQVVSPETGQEAGEGETGLLRVFDLANVRSVMAIQTEDLGVRRGAGFELIGRAVEAEPRGCSLMTA